MGRLIDETGNKYGRLIVLGRSGADIWGAAQWLCECACGNKVVVRGASLRRGNGTKSCGCLWRERASKARILPHGEAAFNQMFTSMRRSATYRKYKWQLTKEQVSTLTKQNCHYCGTKPTQIAKQAGCNGIYTYNGLDRVDNGRGYEINNVVPCCRSCNMAKNIKTTEEFKAWIHRIYEHFVKV